MAKTLDELEEEVLGRSEDEMLHLLGLMLDKLGKHVPEELGARLAEYENDVAEAWYDEADRRLREYRATGEVPEPLDDVLAELRARR